MPPNKKQEEDQLLPQTPQTAKEEIRTHSATRELIMDGSHEETKGRENSHQQGNNT